MRLIATGLEISGKFKTHRAMLTPSKRASSTKFANKKRRLPPPLFIALQLSD